MGITSFLPPSQCRNNEDSLNLTISGFRMTVYMIVPWLLKPYVFIIIFCCPLGGLVFCYPLEVNKVQINSMNFSCLTRESGVKCKTKIEHNIKNKPVLFLTRQTFSFWQANRIEVVAAELLSSCKGLTSRSAWLFSRSLISPPGQNIA